MVELFNSYNLFSRLVAFIWPNKSPRTDSSSRRSDCKEFWELTISFKMLISLKSMRFSSSSMWLFLSTFTARCACDSLCTHIRTSPNAPGQVRNGEQCYNWRCFASTSLRLTSSEDLSNSVIISELSLCLADEIGCPCLCWTHKTFSLTKDHLLVSTIVASFVTL